MEIILECYLLIHSVPFGVMFTKLPEHTLAKTKVKTTLTVGIFGVWIITENKNLCTLPFLNSVVMVSFM